MRKRKKLIALFLTICLAVQFPVKDTGKLVQAAQNRKEFMLDNCRVCVEEQAEWDNGYIANVSITNIGEKPIRNWILPITSLQGNITNVWNGRLVQKEQTIMISALDYNREIKVGETITLGFEMHGECFDALSDISLVESETMELSREGCSVSYNITSQWEQGAIVEAAITNCSDKPIKDWKLSCQFAGEIEDIWNGIVETAEGDTYVIKNNGYNATIYPQETITFGFRAAYPKQTISCPKNEKVTGCNEDEEQEIKPSDTNNNIGDTDEDGLSDDKEMELGTNLEYYDSDEDGLSDYEEVMLYHTNPLLEDTDGDGLSDYDEIQLQFDPLNKDSNGDGILDSEECVEQEIDLKIFRESAEEEYAYISQLTVTARGNANAHVYMDYYDGYLTNDDEEYIAYPVKIEDSGMQSGTIQYSLKDNYEIQEYEVQEQKTNGLLVCYNDNQGGETIPLETTYDSNARTLQAEIAGDGIYFVINVVEIFGTMGIDLEEKPEVTMNQMRSMAKSRSGNTDMVKGKADIVFIVDTTDSMDYYINRVKNNMKAFVKELSNVNVAPAFALVEYKDITADGKESTKIKKNKNSVWFKNVDKFIKRIDSLSVGGGGDIKETPIDALEKARTMKFRKSAQQFFVLVTDTGFKVDNSYGISSMEEMIERLSEDEITVSVVADKRRAETYYSLFHKTGGVFADIEKDFQNQLLGMADHIGAEVNDGYWIAMEGLVPQVVKLDEKPYMNGTTDTDRDGLLDREELKTLEPDRYIKVQPFLKGLKIKAGSTGAYVPVHSVMSKPTVKDTDKDGIPDKTDNRPKTLGYYDKEEGKVIIGKMSIVASNGFPSGHAFLVMKSYVNVTMKVHSWVGGYEYRTWKEKTKEEKQSKYKIKISEWFSIGNSMCGIDEEKEPFESSDDINDGDAGGIYYNREFAYTAKKNEDKYDNNYAYSRKITEKQFRQIEQCCLANSYYHLKKHNCTHVAIKAWNRAFKSDKFEMETLPGKLKKQIGKREGHFQFIITEEVPNT